MAAKVFEVNDVLPATTQLKISWDDTSFLSYTKEFTITCHNIDIIGYSYDDYYGNRIFWVWDGSTPYWGSEIIVWNTGWQYYDSGEYYFSDENGGHNYIICNTTGINEARRTVSMIESDLSGDIPIYWEDLNAPSGYTITFNSNGGTTISDIEEATELPTPLPIPTKSGYTFLGWYYDSDFTNEAFADDPLTGNVTLYAKWELTTYTITYNSNGGSSIPQTSDATQLPNPLPIPTKSGYTFVAWYYESNFQTRAKAGDTIEANTTLYAKWHNLGSLFTEIANAIRSKDGTSENIRDVDFGDRIKQIQGAKEEETKTLEPDFSGGNQVITPTSGKVLSQVTLIKPADMASKILEGETLMGVSGTASGSGGEIISLMATSEYYASKTGTQSSALRWRCSTELFNKPIFIDANGNLYTPAQVNVYFNGTYKTRADTTLYTFGTYSTTMTGTITFKTVSGGITVSLINLDYAEEFWGTGVYFHFDAGISWSVGGGSTGVSLETRWASICSVQKTWLNNFSDITDGYFSDSAVIDSIIIANGGAIDGFSIHLQDPD